MAQRQHCNIGFANNRFQQESLAGLAISQKSDRQCSVQQCWNLFGRHKFAQSQLDIRTNPPISFDCFWQGCEHHGTAESNVKHPLFTCSQPTCHLQVIPHFGESIQRSVGEELADSREFHPARGPVKQGISEHPLEILDLLAKWRLGYSECLRSFTEM